MAALDERALAKAMRQVADDFDAHPSLWCMGDYMLDRNGMACHHHPEDAARCCAIGGVALVLDTDPVKVTDALNDVSIGLANDLAYCNDRLGRHKVVQDLRSVAARLDTGAFL